jgi:hypothetical protein
LLPVDISLPWENSEKQTKNKEKLHEKFIQKKTLFYQSGIILAPK